MTTTTTEVIAWALLQEKVTRAAVQHDSKVPDSLGDQLFRLSLKMSWASGHPDTSPPSPGLAEEARRLLAVAEKFRSRANHPYKTELVRDFDGHALVSEMLEAFLGILMTTSQPE